MENRVEGGEPNKLEEIMFTGDNQWWGEVGCCTVQ